MEANHLAVSSCVDDTSLLERPSGCTYDVKRPHWVEQNSNQALSISTGLTDIQTVMSVGRDVTP